MKVAELAAWLDRFLRTAEVGDDPQALNGLQVDGSRDVTRVAVAVDACRTVFDQAARLKAEFLVAHHGLFWGGIEPLTGRNFRRVSTLIQNGIALYGAHIPLDIHPEVGNNAVMCRLLGIPVQGSWGEYHGGKVASWGEAAMSRDELTSRLAGVIGAAPRLLGFGPSNVRRIGVVTGAGGSMIAEAHALGLDTLVTGEGKHHSFFDAEELGLNVYYGGHYATETLGVKALGERLQRELGLPWTFIDHPTGL